MNNQLKTVRNLARLLMQNLRLFIVFTLTILLTSILGATGIGSLYPIVSLLEDSSKKLIYMQQINGLFHLGLGEDRFTAIMFAGAGAVFLISGLFFIVSFYVQYRLSEGLKAKWQTDIFGIYLDQEYNYFVKHKAGDLIQRQMAHTEMAGSAVVYACQMARDFFLSIFLFVMLLLISVRITLFVSILMLILTAVSLALSKLKVYVLANEHAHMQKEAYSTAVEAIAGIRQVKAFLAENYFKNKFAFAVGRKAHLYIKNATIGQAPAPVLQTIVLVSMVSVLCYMSIYTGNTKGLLPLITVFGGALYRVFGSMAGIHGNMLQIAHVLPSVNVVSDLLDKQAAPERLPEIDSFERDIVFRNVSFSYPQKEFHLTDLNMTFEKGKFYGIAGPSGSGKSTFVDLIIKFYSPRNGQILVDNRELSRIDTHSWMNKIGLISQETFIFNGTIRENISFAMDEAGIDDKKIRAAAKVANLHDFIEELRDGYETVVGERGLKLSGGQRQRLAIARAVYRDPYIYIFDEATSSLDTHAENRIQQSIENLSRTKTVISIAHRLSTIMKADKIIVMNRGRIVETGSHQELLGKGGFYYGMYSTQVLPDNTLDKVDVAN